MSDHERFVTNEFFEPIQTRVRALLEMNDIPWANETMTRLALSIHSWRARFSGLFETCSESPQTFAQQRMATMHKLWITIRMEVDGIRVGDEGFEFADAVQNHGRYDTAIDGSAWVIYEIVAPILKDGFPPETKTD